MPIVRVNNQRIYTKDVQALKDMLRQSIGSHITFLNEKYAQFTSKNVKRSKQILLTAFQNAFNDVRGIHEEITEKARKTRLSRFYGLFR